MNIHVLFGMSKIDRISTRQILPPVEDSSLRIQRLGPLSPTGVVSGSTFWWLCQVLQGWVVLSGSTRLDGCVRLGQVGWLCQVLQG